VVLNIFPKIKVFKKQILQMTTIHRMKIPPSLDSPISILSFGVFSCENLTGEIEISNRFFLFILKSRSEKIKKKR